MPKGDIEEAVKDIPYESNLHMFQKEADRIDFIIMSYLDNIEQCNKGVFDPHLRMAYANIRNMYYHIIALMAEKDRTSILETFKKMNFDFYFREGDDIGGDTTYLLERPLQNMLEVENIFCQFMLDRQKVGMGVRAAKDLEKFAAGTRGLKPIKED